MSMFIQSQSLPNRHATKSIKNIGDDIVGVTVNVIRCTTFCLTQTADVLVKQVNLSPSLFCVDISVPSRWFSTFCLVRRILKDNIIALFFLIHGIGVFADLPFSNGIYFFDMLVQNIIVMINTKEKCLKCQKHAVGFAWIYHVAVVMQFTYKLKHMSY